MHRVLMVTKMMINRVSLQSSYQCIDSRKLTLNVLKYFVENAFLFASYLGFCSTKTNKNHNREILRVACPNCQYNAC